MERKVDYWVTPPKADAGFVTGVEEVPEIREPLPAMPEHPDRVDCECEGTVTAAVFLFCEPRSGGWEATARECGTKADRTREIAALLEGGYAGCGCCQGNWFVRQDCVVNLKDLSHCTHPEFSGEHLDVLQILIAAGVRFHCKQVGRRGPTR